MGGGMGGGGMGARTMPPMMGLMMLGRLIMMLTGERDSWDMRSLMMGMMGGMRGGMGGMGGMGGGMMGGMGGMGMGGMMGGMRSVPPTGVPFAKLEPGQTRHLPTRLVSLRGPAPDGHVALPQKGEPLQIGDISLLTNDSWTQQALKRIAIAKAPPTIAQLVMWHVAVGLEWKTIAQLSKSWANPYEVALARDLVDRLREAEGKPLSEREAGSLRWELTSRRSDQDPLAAELRKLLDGQSVLGLTARETIPARPEAPAVACRIRLDGKSALVQVSASDAAAVSWTPVGKFSVDLTDAEGQDLKASAVADALAEKLLGRLADARLMAGPKQKGKPTYKIRLINASPLILNGLALGGAKTSGEIRPTALAGFSLAPHRTWDVPVGAEAVERLGLKDGIRVLAADLSAL
jgi:hypothetical protein